jgi:hypothetical protein
VQADGQIRADDPGPVPQSTTRAGRERHVVVTPAVGGRAGGPDGCAGQDVLFTDADAEAKPAAVNGVDLGGAAVLVGGGR